MFEPYSELDEQDRIILIDPILARFMQKSQRNQKQTNSLGTLCAASGTSGTCD
jgi:hypothetical protein